MCRIIYQTEFYVCKHRYNPSIRACEDPLSEECAENGFKELSICALDTCCPDCEPELYNTLSEPQKETFELCVRPGKREVWCFIPRDCTDDEWELVDVDPEEDGDAEAKTVSDTEKVSETKSKADDSNGAK